MHYAPIRQFLRITLPILSICFSSSTQTLDTSVLTGQYNNSRTAANMAEPILNTSNVGVQKFGKLYFIQVDGLVFAQPLYVPNLQMGQGRMNVLFVATMHNSIYAFNADDASQPPLWQVTLEDSVPSNLAGACPDPGYTGPELGILSTPVIDASTQTLYAVAATPVPGKSRYIHKLFALNLKDGSPKNGSSVVMSGAVLGASPDARNGTLTMNKRRMIQRTALLLANGAVYAGFSGCGPDPDPYHGWVLGYDAANVQNQVAVFSATPNGNKGGIWQSGRGLASNQAGSIYLMSGNGDADNDSEFGSSFVRMDGGGNVVDWFTPENVDMLNLNDVDLGASGPILTPDSNLLIGGGKQGRLYVFSPDSPDTMTNPRQIFQATAPCQDPDAGNGCQQIRFPAYWASSATPSFYIWAFNDTLRAYRFRNGRFSTTPDSQGSDYADYPGGALSVSSFGQKAGTGIVWALTPGLLRAYDATDVSRELWNSNQNQGRDSIGRYDRLSQFTVANGKVFVPGAAARVLVYGLLPNNAQ